MADIQFPRSNPASEAGELGSTNKIRANTCDEIPVGECVYFDEAYERCRRLVDLDLSSLDINMFSAINNDLVNDGCGLYRGRLILPYEHLSRHQNELVD